MEQLLYALGIVYTTIRADDDDDDDYDDKASLATSFGGIRYKKDSTFHCNYVMYHTHSHITECIGKLEALFQNVKHD